MDDAVIVVGWDWLVRHTQESGEYYRREAETRLLLGNPPQRIINDPPASLTRSRELRKFDTVDKKRAE